MDNLKILKEALHNAIKDEIEKDGMDKVSEKYEINKIDRAKLVLDEFDGKLSKFVEIMNKNGYVISITNEDETMDVSSIVENSELYKEQQEVITELELTINNLNITLASKNDEIKGINEESAKKAEEITNLTNKVNELTSNLENSDSSNRVGKSFFVGKKQKDVEYYDSTMYGRMPNGKK